MSTSEVWTVNQVKKERSHIEEFQPSCLKQPDNFGKSVQANTSLKKIDRAISI